MGQTGRSHNTGEEGAAAVEEVEFSVSRRKSEVGATKTKGAGKGLPVRVEV